MPPRLITHWKLPTAAAAGLHSTSCGMLVIDCAACVLAAPATFPPPGGLPPGGGVLPLAVAVVGWVPGAGGGLPPGGGVLPLAVGVPTSDGDELGTAHPSRTPMGVVADFSRSNIFWFANGSIEATRMKNVSK